MRRVDVSRSAAIVLWLLGCNVWKAVTKTLQEDQDIKEVILKVHLSDASTHQPIGGATIQIFTNQTSLTTETSGTDGNVFMKFQYRVGTLLIVTASRHGYVPNSAPWRPARLPVFSSLSLDLLPERTATLMVYEDVVQIVSGYQGSRGQPWVQFQRRALSLPANSTYTNLTALLTLASSPHELQRFPDLLGLGGNGTGSDSRFELKPVTAISVHLLGSDGAELYVTEPISITVPLPPNSGLEENDHIPAWRFDPRLGVWLKSSLGHVQRDGEQLTLTYITPQLGYWVAATSPFNTGPVVAKDISTYHTVFLLAILGGMALILLCLLCLLVYYCRRCLNPRQHHRKLQLAAAQEGAKRDQATSMSHLNLINEVQLELASSGAEPDMTTPMLKPQALSRSVRSREDLASLSSRSRGSLNNLTARAALLKDCHKSVESFPLKSANSADPSDGYESPRGEYRRSSASITSSSHPLLERREQQAPSGGRSGVRETACPSPTTPTREALERRPPDYLLSRSVDHLERPTSFPRPGQLLCCSSVDQVTDGAYRRVRPTLVIPAHYMKLPGEHPFAGQALLLQTDQQSDLETIQAELTASHQPLGPQGSEGTQLSSQNPSQQGLPSKGPDGEWTLQTTSLPESLSIPTALGEAGLVQMNGEDTLLAERTLMELRGGKPLPHPRAWFVSLDGRSNAHIRHSYIDLQRAGRAGNGSNDASLDSGVDMNEPKLSRRLRERTREREREKERKKEREKERGELERSSPPTVSYTQLVYVEANGSDGSTPEAPALGDEVVVGEEEAPSPLSPHPLPDPEGAVFRTEHAQTQLQLPPSSPPDDSGEDENKKSPWQKREERPLLSFNLK